MHAYLHGMADLLLIFGELIKILGGGESSKELPCKTAVPGFSRLNIDAR